MHTYLNLFLYIWMTSINFFGGAFLWGGSMAIRRKDFEDLKVAECWEHAVVDDNSLSRILMKKSKRTIVVPACVTPTNDLLASVTKSIVWFTRQVNVFESPRKTALVFCGAAVWCSSHFSVCLVAAFSYIQCGFSENFF